MPEWKHRMPLILPGKLVNEWISPEGNPEELMAHAVTEMMFEKL